VNDYVQKTDAHRLAHLANRDIQVKQPIFAFAAERRQSSKALLSRPPCYVIEIATHCPSVGSPYQILMIDLAVTLGRLCFKNPILVASGTFGYAREMAAWSIRPTGGIVPKTVTKAPRRQQKPPRTVETAAGMLNAIASTTTASIISSTPPSLLENAPHGCRRQHRRKKRRRNSSPWPSRSARPTGLAGLELNLSVRNVAGGTDFPPPIRNVTHRIVAGVRKVCPLPIIAKLTPT